MDRLVERLDTRISHHLLTILLDNLTLRFMRGTEKILLARITYYCIMSARKNSQLNLSYPLTPFLSSQAAASSVTFSSIVSRLSLVAWQRAADEGNGGGENGGSGMQDAVRQCDC